MLSEIVSELLDEMPPDPTNLEDVVHSSLCTCGPICLETADAVLLRIPLCLQPILNSEEGAEEQVLSPW